MKKKAKTAKKPKVKPAKKQGSKKAKKPPKAETTTDPPQRGGLPEQPTPGSLPKNPPRAPRKPGKPGRPRKVQPEPVQPEPVQPEPVQGLPGGMPAPGDPGYVPTVTDKARAGARMLTRLEISISNKIWEPQVTEEEAAFVEDGWYEYLLVEGGDIPPWLGLLVSQGAVFGMRWYVNSKAKAAQAAAEESQKEWQDNKTTE